MPKLNLKDAIKIKRPSGEVLALKGKNFQWGGQPASPVRAISLQIGLDYIGEDVATGVFPVSYWQNFSGSSLSLVKDSVGAASPINITTRSWRGPSYGYRPVLDATPETKIFDSGAPSGGAFCDIYFNNIPYTLYDIIVYFTESPTLSGATFSGASTMSFAPGPSYNMPRNRETRWKGAYVEGQSGNYFRVDNNTSSNLTIIHSAGYRLLCGLQIIEKKS